MCAQVCAHVKRVKSATMCAYNKSDTIYIVGYSSYVFVSTSSIKKESGVGGLRNILSLSLFLLLHFADCVARMLSRFYFYNILY